MRIISAEFQKGVGVAEVEFGFLVKRRTLVLVEFYCLYETINFTGAFRVDTSERLDSDDAKKVYEALRLSALKSLLENKPPCPPCLRGE